MRMKILAIGALLAALALIPATLALAQQGSSDESGPALQGIDESTDWHSGMHRWMLEGLSGDEDHFGQMPMFDEDHFGQMPMFDDGT